MGNVAELSNADAAELPEMETSSEIAFRGKAETLPRRAELLFSWINKAKLFFERQKLAAALKNGEEQFLEAAPREFPFPISVAKNAAFRKRLSDLKRAL